MFENTMFLLKKCKESPLNPLAKKVPSEMLLDFKIQIGDLFPNQLE